MIGQPSSSGGGATLATISDMSAFMRTVNDDTTAEAARATLGAQATSNLVAPVKCTSQLSVSNSTVYADVTGMSIAIPSTGYWWVEINLTTTAGASGGIKAQLAGPTFTVYGGNCYPENASNGSGVNITTAEFLTVTGAVTFQWARLLINVTDITNPLKLQASQNVSNATPTVVTTNSIMHVQKAAA